MRWLIPTLGALGLVAALYLGLAPRLRRPVLRLAMELEAGNADDAARAEGVALALEERDFRAGRWRLAAAPQIRRGWALEFPTPRAHMWLHGISNPIPYPGPDGPLLALDVRQEEAALRHWMKERKLDLLELPNLRPDPSGGLYPHPEARRGIRVPEPPPDAFFLWSGFNVSPNHYKAVREQGFTGPVIVSTHWIGAVQLPSFEGASFILAPLKPGPSSFRHPHPFAYAGYRGALRICDALDADPAGDPFAIVRDAGSVSIFAELMDEPRVYEVKGGRLVELK